MFPTVHVDASKVVGASPSPVTVWDSRALRQFRNNPQANGLYAAIDELGRGSKVAQGLNNVLTSVERLHDNPSHRLYLLAKGKDFIGILKIGTKKLFIRTRSGDLREIDPLCVLDFYVVETEQRSGFGRVMYDAVLEREGVQPHNLGYDRPSPKFLGFLRKHFGLSDFIPQTNNFVVFEQYFSGRPAAVSAPARSNAAAMAAPVVAPRQQQHVHAASPQPRGSTGHDDPPRGGIPPAPIPLNRPVYAQLPSKSAAVTNSGGGSSSIFGGQVAQPGGGAQRGVTLPSMSSALAASLPAKRGAAEAGLSASMLARRNQSPTRSGAGYNIITMADEEAGAAQVAPPQPMSRTYGGRR